MTRILVTNNRFLMKVENTLEYGWWAKTQTLLETLNVTNQDLYPNIYAIFTVLIPMPVSSTSSEHSFSAMHRVKKCLWATMGDERFIKFIVVTHPQNKKSKRRRCYQQICSEKKQTSGLYLITSPCCWTWWWLHVLTWTLKLYSLNISGNVSFIHIAFMIIFAIDSMLCDAEFL